jgi:rare lipoprotein A
VKHRISGNARNARSVVRNALMATALAALLTAWTGMGPALAHAQRLKKTEQRHAHQSAPIGEASGRRILRDKMMESANGSQSPRERLAPSGIASVYSDHNTASGEPMNSAAMTAAHRTLPFGTRVTVINRNNGRSAVVRINDRGPFVHGRVIDLSPAAADALKVDGLAPVSLIVESGVDDERNGRLPGDEKESPPELASPSALLAEPAQTPPLATYP